MPLIAHGIKRPKFTTLDIARVVNHAISQSCQTVLTNSDWQKAFPRHLRSQINMLLSELRRQTLRSVLTPNNPGIQLNLDNLTLVLKALHRHKRIYRSVNNLHTKLNALRFAIETVNEALKQGEGTISHRDMDRAITNCATPESTLPGLFQDLHDRLEKPDERPTRDELIQGIQTVYTGLKRHSEEKGVNLQDLKIGYLAVQEFIKELLKLPKNAKLPIVKIANKAKAVANQITAHHKLMTIRKIAAEAVNQANADSTQSLLLAAQSIKQLLCELPETAYSLIAGAASPPTARIKAKEFNEIIQKCDSHSALIKELTEKSRVDFSKLENAINLLKAKTSSPAAPAQTETPASALSHLLALNFSDTPQPTSAPELLQKSEEAERVLVKELVGDMLTQLDNAKKQAGRTYCQSTRESRNIVNDALDTFIENTRKILRTPNFNNPSAEDLLRAIQTAYNNDFHKQVNSNCDKKRMTNLAYSAQKIVARSLDGISSGALCVLELGVKRSPLSRYKTVTTTSIQSADQNPPLPVTTPR